MNQEINWERLHHAYFVVGKREEKDFFVELVSKNTNFDASGNPDFSIIEVDTFGIDDARELSGWMIEKPFSGEKKIKIVFANSVTSESQNALLKVLEEPTVGSIIFFVVPSVGNLYKTLLSRVLVVYSLFEDKDNKKDIAEEFLSKNLALRIGLIQKMQKGDDKEMMKNLVRSLETTFYKKVKSGSIKDGYKILKEVDNCLRFSSSRGASAKMILEYLSCILPVV